MNDYEKEMTRLAELYILADEEFSRLSSRGAEISKYVERIQHTQRITQAEIATRAAYLDMVEVFHARADAHYREVTKLIVEHTKRKRDESDESD